MKADPNAGAAPASNSKKKLLVMLIAGLVVVGGGGGAAFMLTRGHGDAGKEEHKEVKQEKPVYVVVEPFTVNLQPESGTDQYLQLQFTLQVNGEKQELLVKDNMAKIRSRVLLLLSGKKASEINTVEGKRQLANEIMASVQAPFVDKGPKQEVNDVLFTSFIIQ